MSLIILTSSVNEVAQDIVSYLPRPATGQKLLFIDTAAEVETGPRKWLQRDRQALVDVGFVVTDFTLTDKTTSQIKTALAETDVIYVSGGNTFFLLQQVQKSGALPLLRAAVLEEGKAYLSTSAGSILAGPDTYPTLRLDKLEFAPELQGYQGLGLVNFVVLPHWGSPHFKALYLESRLEHAYHKDQQPLLALTDTQYVVVADGKMEIVTTKKV